MTGQTIPSAVLWDDSPDGLAEVISAGVTSAAVTSAGVTSAGVIVTMVTDERGT